MVKKKGHHFCCMLQNCPFALPKTKKEGNHLHSPTPLLIPIGSPAAEEKEGSFKKAQKIDPDPGS